MRRLHKRSWFHPLGVLALLVSISVASGGVAQTAQVTGAEEVSASTAEERDADVRVRDMIEEWERNDPVARSYLDMDDLSVVTGTARVALLTQDKRWGKARSLAYTQAFLDAMEDYVARIRTETAESLVRDYFEQDLDESELDYRAADTSEDVLARLFEKTAVLKERRLDEALIESGMSAEDVERLTPPQKRTGFSDRIVRQSTKKAVGSAAGLVPVKTFEAYDDEGGSAIGVVAVHSHDMQRIADRIAAGKAISPKHDRARTPIADRIGALSNAALAFEFGPRVWWDEQGYPTIVSFGQWAWSPAGLDKRKRARRRDFAMRQAEIIAKSDLTKFVHAATGFTNESEIGSEIEEVFVAWDGTVEEIDGEVLTDKLWRKATTQSEVELTGLTVLREWRGPHPEVDGHELVGVIVSWSPAQEDQIRAELGKKPKHQSAVEKKAGSAPVSSGSAESLDLMDPRDF